MNRPIPGCFLLATPLLSGSWFQDKVILLAEHSEQSSYGFAMNHSARIPIDDVFSGFKSKERKPFRFFFGGPVQEDMVQVLEVGRSQFPDSPELMPGVWLRQITDEEPVPILDLFTEPTTRIILGYSGWAAGQLESEIDRGCWELVFPDPAEILSHSRDEIFASPAEFKRQFALP